MLSCSSLEMIYFFTKVNRSLFNFILITPGVAFSESVVWFALKVVVSKSCLYFSKIFFEQLIRLLQWRWVTMIFPSTWTIFSWIPLQWRRPRLSDMRLSWSTCVHCYNVARSVSSIITASLSLGDWIVLTGWAHLYY